MERSATTGFGDNCILNLLTNWSVSIIWIVLILTSSADNRRLIQNVSALALINPISAFQYIYIYFYLFLLAYIAILFPWCLHPVLLSYIYAAQSCSFSSLMCLAMEPGSVKLTSQNCLFPSLQARADVFLNLSFLSVDNQCMQCSKWRLDWVLGSSAGTAQALLEMTRLINLVIMFNPESLRTSLESIFILLLGLPLPTQWKIVLLFALILQNPS